MNDSDFIRRLREQDPTAVRHLSECHLPSVWRFVYVRVSGDPHLAEDIVSETVLALIRAATAAEVEINNVGGWLRTVAGNKVNDHFRAAARVQHLLDQTRQTAEAADHRDAAGEEELAERRAEIRGVMDQLSGPHRDVLEWKYLDKLSVREIAERMGITEKAAESILFRARRDFRDRITRQDHGVRPDGKSCCSASLGIDGPSRSEPAHTEESSSKETRIPVNHRE